MVREKYNMKWKKLGLIFNTNGLQSWSKSHAAVPFAENIKDDLFRIYFTTRDANNRGSMTFVEIDINNPQQILYTPNEPVLFPGELGHFDDNGVTVSSIVTHENKKFLYYIGWNQGKNILYHTSIGLAISNDNGKTFEKYSNVPILDRNEVDPLNCSNPWVIFEKGLWKMWYISFLRWTKEDKLKPYYHIKYAESSDGINWNRNGIVAINFKDEQEWGISRPCVLKDSDGYKMWYSYSSDKPYRIGYAESNDSIKWIRKDEQVGISPSNEGWDSESVEYPFVFDHKNNRYMLYCGNGFGKTGFGLAILEN